jgi:hypothetical protein
MKQQSDEKAFAEYISFASRSSDEGLELRAAYTLSNGDLLTPYILFIETRPNLPPEKKSPEMIKWQFNEGDWATYPHRYNYPDQRGNFSYKIGQSGSPGLSFRTEWLEKLKQGGRFAVIRLLADGQEVSMGSVDYPDQKEIADTFGEARNKALASLAPCKPPVNSVPAAR